jgi:galactonate dehydratase
MKITALRTFVVPPRWLFLKIETDEGVSGWGEPVLEGHAETLAAKIAEYATFLVGRDPARIGDIWQTLYRNGCYRDGPVLMSAISGIDMALWDIQGKVLDRPVHALLGGRVRDRIRAYTWIGGDTADTLIEDAHRARADGYVAAKFNVAGAVPMIASHAEVDAIVARIGALRDAVGPGFDLAVDFHGRASVAMAKVLLKELEPLRPIFVEDPVLPGQIAAMADLARGTSIPLACGERLHSMAAFREVFERRAAGIVNPDTAHVGGITAMVRIGAWAEACDVALAPHCPLGPIAFAACLQVDAVCHNAVLQEHASRIHYNGDIGHGTYVAGGAGAALRDGFVAIPDGPGLGVEVDEAAVAEKAAQGHAWRAPVWRHADGSIAEW